jgi:pimeloyl-ACP methyl ester carboxylesterase
MGERSDSTWIDSWKNRRCSVPSAIPETLTRSDVVMNCTRIAIDAIAALLAFLLLPQVALAQTTVRAWSAAGQVFVVWRVDATAPLTYDIYRSPTVVTSTTKATLVGRVFQPEWRGARLQLVDQSATWRIPSADGGTYQLAANEGLFVYTPRAGASEHFAVVRNGSTAISATNRTTAPVAVVYDPANAPVTCHLQYTGVTTRGYPFKTWAMWVDGRDNPADSRPDYPVMANAAKHGAPHVFTVFEPIAGLPAGPYPATVCLHGGGPSGAHWSWAPESVHYANTGSIPRGAVTVAMDDRLFVATNGVVNLDRPSNWFGWWPGMDPVGSNLPPNNAVVVPYTLRRLVWTIDWLHNRSPYSIDPQRTSVMGNSMGGAGTLLLSRFRPERFSAATAFVPQHYTPETGQRLFGTTAQNLQTTEVGPSGTTLRVNDFFDAAVRLSATQRDYCLTRIFRGRRDDAVNWGALTIQLFEAMSAGRFGTHLYWDNRDHTASDWTTDDPTVPGVDIGEWVFPERTERAGAPYQARFRADQSFPGFFNDDQQPGTPGRQPTLGNGSPDDGTPWGTWCGYFDWDTETIFDTTQGWSCTMYLVGRSSTAVDNYPGTTATTSVTVRKPRRIVPNAGATVTWTLRDDRTDAVLQSGTVAAETQGLVSISGLVIPKDPQRVRLELRVGSAQRPGDLNGDGAIDSADLKLITASPIDLDGDGVAGAADIAMLERYLIRYQCLGDLNGDGTVNGADLAQLLVSWGPCSGACAADLDGDGAVNGTDIATLLADWGACP